MVVFFFLCLSKLLQRLHVTAILATLITETRRSMTGLCLQFFFGINVGKLKDNDFEHKRKRQRRVDALSLTRHFS